MFERKSPNSDPLQYYQPFKSLELAKAMIIFGEETPQTLSIILYNKDEKLGDLRTFPVI